MDLIENAASLLQYKISTSKDFPTWQEFSRWCKRNPSYTRIIDFVRSFIENDDLAVRIFLPLVQVAFETNKPIHAFAILLSAFKTNYKSGALKQFVEQPEPCRWIELFDRYADKMPLSEPEYGNLLSKKFFRLDRYETSQSTIGGKLRHPIVGQFVKEWGELEKKSISYRSAFTAPNGYLKQVESILEVFNSPICLLKFTLRGENVAVVIGDLQRSGLAYIGDDRLADKDIKGLFVELLTIFGVVRRFNNALMAPNFRLCHHTECPLYERNLCNTWIFIPARYEDCSFQTRVNKIKVEGIGSGSPGTKTEIQVMVGGSPDMWPKNIGRADHEIFR